MNFFEQIIYLIKEYYDVFLSGLGITLLLAICGTIFGLIIGMFLALGRNLTCNKNDNTFIKIIKIITSKLCLVYIEVFRGTPMMVQALIIFFGGYTLGIEWNPIVCGLIIITLNTAAYMAEIVRSGINSVDLGQIEASRSLGMSHFKTMLYVVWPQALRNALPTIANELIVNIKDSSVLNIITVSELFMAGQIAATTYMTVASYTIVALIYLTLTLLCSFLLKLIEKKMDEDTVIAGRKLKMKVVTYDD